MRDFFGPWLILVGACFLAQVLIHASVSGQSPEASDAGYFPATTSIFRGEVISPTLIACCGAAALVAGALLLFLGASQTHSRAPFEPQITPEMHSSAWYVRVKDEIQGPYAFPQIREWILEKSLLPEDLIRMGPDAPFYEVRSLSAVLFGPVDAKSELGGPLTRRETYLLAARAQRRLIWTFLLSLPLQIAAPFMGYFGDPPVSLAGELLSLTITAGLAYCIGELAAAIGHSRLLWVLLFLLLGCTPGVPLFILIIVNKLATWHFREAHIVGGLFGPSEDDVLRAT